MVLTRMIQRSIERRSRVVNLGNPKDPALLQLFGVGADTTAGEPVTEATAYTLAAMYCGIRCIAETSSMLPLGVYQEEADDLMLRKDSAAWKVLNNPNKAMTRVSFRRAMVANCIWYGNAYAEIAFDGSMQPKQLWPIHPTKMVVKRLPGGGLSYAVKSDDRSKPDRPIPARKVIHVPALSGDGDIGQGLDTFARESLGLGIAADRFGASFFGNGGTPSGILQLSKPATAERKIEIGEAWKRQMGGRKQNSVAVMDHESSYQTIGTKPEEAQFIETRLYQVQEVARWLRLSPTKLFDFSRSTFSNIEEINRAFADESIRPWTVAFDQEFSRKLLTETEQETWEVKHDIAGLLVGDIETQGQFWALARQWGWLNVNEIRRSMNLNGIGEDGNIYLSPMNMVPAGEEVEPDESENEPEPSDNPDDPPTAPAGVPGDTTPRNVEQITELATQLRDVAESLASVRTEIAEVRRAERVRGVRNVVARMIAKEQIDAAKASRKGQFVGWLERFYIRHADKMMAALSAEGCECRDAVVSHCCDSKDLLLTAAECQPEELADRVAACVESWESRTETFLERAMR